MSEAKMEEILKALAAIEETIKSFQAGPEVQEQPEGKPSEHIILEETLDNINDHLRITDYAIQLHISEPPLTPADFLDWKKSLYKIILLGLPISGIHCFHCNLNKANEPAGEYCKNCTFRKYKGLCTEANSWYATFNQTLKILHAHIDDIDDYSPPQCFQGTFWALKDEQLLQNYFQTFCRLLGWHLRRSPNAIACKTRHLMNDKIIETWG